MKFIIDHKNSSKINAAFRAFNKGSVDYYTSTRIGGILADKDGFVIAVPDEHIGKDYELKDIGSMKVISKGRIQKSEFSSQKEELKIDDKKQKSEAKANDGK
jgi:hypothetical protein